MPEETFKTPQPQPRADRPLDETQPTNWPKIILVAVLGFALLAGSAYAGYWYGTHNWKTYNSEKYSFEIKYPPLWDASQDMAGASFVAGEKNLKFEIILLDKTHEKLCGPYRCYPSIHIATPFKDNSKIKLSLEGLVKKFFMDRKITLTEEAFNSLVLEKTNIDNFPAIKVKSSVPGSEYIFISNNDTIYPIIFVDKNPTFDQILSTFKFLD